MVYLLALLFTFLIEVPSSYILHLKLCLEIFNTNRSIFKIICEEKGRNKIRNFCFGTSGQDSIEHLCCENENLINYSIALHLLLYLNYNQIFIIYLLFWLRVSSCIHRILKFFFLYLNLFKDYFLFVFKLSYSNGSHDIF